MWLQQPFIIFNAKVKDNTTFSYRLTYYFSSHCCNILLHKSTNNIDQLVFKFATILLKHNTAVIRIPELICNHISNIFLHYQLNSLKFYFVFIPFNFFLIETIELLEPANFNAILRQLFASLKNGP